MSTTTISFTNSLNFSVQVYDSFSPQDTSNYFGILTLLATVPANSTAPVNLIRSSSVLIASNATTNSPLARFIYLPNVNTGPFAVGQADMDAMAQAIDFITFIISNPQDPLTVAFNALWKDQTKPLVAPVTNFFAQHPTYASCTFATYIMGIVYAAEQPVSKSMPMDQAVYSLSSLVTSMGGSWPTGFPDVTVTKFTCNTSNGVLAIQAEVDISLLPAKSDEALNFFTSLFDSQQLQTSIRINHAISSGLVGTELAIRLDTMQVPCGDLGTMTINNPTATIDLNPLYRFVTFEVAGSIPFDIFDKKFDADVNMTIDNLEASFGVVIDGDDTTLPTPTLMKGVHFSSFGVGIGVFYEPPGAVVGLSGQLQIGDAASGTQAIFDDNSFVVMCQLESGVPNPLYVFFYVPQMELTDVITIFTNSQCPLQVPVSFKDLFFQWSENPTENVVLPDGSHSLMGYGFRCRADIRFLSFYGDVAIDLQDGLKADIEMAPLSFGSLFLLEGNGRGVNVKVDAAGNPINNNHLATTVAQRQAIKDATTQQLVAGGGPVLKIETSTSPYLHLYASVSLFEVSNEQLTAKITSTAITFDLDFSGISNSKMSCALNGLDNMSATFEYGIDQNIALPTINNVSLGSLDLETTISTHLGLVLTPSSVIITVGGSFDFEGATLTISDFVVAVFISTLSDIQAVIVSQIEQDAGNIFSTLLSTAAQWASKVAQGVITAVDSVASVLLNVWDQTASEVADTMKDAGFDAQDIATGLKDFFNLGPSEIHGLLRQIGFSDREIFMVFQAFGGPSFGQFASTLSGGGGGDVLDGL
ncbi:hypothetical protein BKA59DRAFT_518578 [Fusarium tricinctum]|uniref:Uncharacterized protein n=1 Tax=Fusarium tricinctum TaxID=61284 RepID=A0A8K0S3A9_9HYPO|nr:hypothetical protein BKA59DRAFT_518578 [Fusarium tricinctum]